MKKGFFISTSILGLAALSIGVLSQDLYGSAQSTDPSTPGEIQTEITRLSQDSPSDMTAAKVQALQKKLQSIQSSSALGGSAGVSEVVTSSISGLHSLKAVPKPVEKSLPDAPKRVNNDDHRGINFPEACARVNLSGNQGDASAIDPEHPGDFQVVHGWLEPSVIMNKLNFVTTEHSQDFVHFEQFSYQISSDVGEISKGRIDHDRMQFLLKVTKPGYGVLAVLDRVGNFVKCIGAPSKEIVHGKVLTPERISQSKINNKGR